MPSGLPQVTVTRPKPWWQSRMLVVNAAALALAGVESQLDVLQPMLPVNVYAVMSVALPIINMGLRTVTSQPLTTSKE